MASYKHFLITRFNLSEATWPQDGNRPPPVLDDDWIASRIPLFRDYCLHSVAAQTEKSFEWLIFLDIRTASHFRDELGALVAGFPFIRLLYIDGMQAFLPAIRAYIASAAQGCSHVITSRVDNDDALHCEFIAAVQSQFCGQAFQAIDFARGYALQIAPQVRLGNNDQISNPFVSLIEENNSPKTVLSRPHAHWKKTNSKERYRLVDDSRRLWLTVTHLRNKANQFRGYGSVDWRVVHKSVLVAPAVRDEIAQQLVPASAWCFGNLYNRWRVRSSVAAALLKRRLGRYRDE